MGSARAEVKGEQLMSESLDFDADALREKYRHERDRRLRPEANGQYVEVAGDFSHYVDDPHVDPGFTRKPLMDAVDAVIVGGGFGGLLAAARLRESGVKDIRIIEKAGDFGGTWYWNRFPGAQCDIESYIYLPLLEETGYIPKEKYSFGEEIRAYARRIGEHFDLYRLACFQTEISEMRWLQDKNQWLITTNRDDAMHARFVVISSGPLNRPKLPGIPGIETFKGHSFHTSRWDYGYTGGSTEGGLTKLADKRVAIIGTGATAIQCVPHLGRHAKHLYVFQRTPSSVDVRGNKPTDPEWVKTLTPGWQKRRMENFNAMFSGLPQDVLRPPARRGLRQRRLDRHLPQPRPRRRGPRCPGWRCARTTRPDDRDLRFQEDEPGTRPGRRHGQGLQDRRGAEALVPPVLQTADLQ
jgi:cyclohexanone monooxygenase